MLNIFPSRTQDEWKFCEAVLPVVPTVMLLLLLLLLQFLPNVIVDELGEVNSFLDSMCGIDNDWARNFTSQKMSALRSLSKQIAKLGNRISRNGTPFTTICILLPYRWMSISITRWFAWMPISSNAAFSSEPEIDLVPALSCRKNIW